jgi:hypothetical protein
MDHLTVNRVAHAPPQDSATARSSRDSSARHTQSATASSDRVQISTAAREAAKKADVEKSTESNTETTREARSDDRQAQRLAAKYASHSYSF